MLYQETELCGRNSRIRDERITKKMEEKLEERRQAVVEERKAAKEAALAEKGETEDATANEDQDDIDEEDEIDVHLTAEEEKEIRDAVGEDNDDERITLINEKLDEIKKVLALASNHRNLNLEPLKLKEGPSAEGPQKPVGRARRACGCSFH